MRVVSMVSNWGELRHHNPRTVLASAFLACVAIGISLAVIAVVASLGAPVILVLVWVAMTALIIRWPFPALLTYVSLIPWSPEYLGLEAPKIMALNGPRLLGLCFLPGLLLSLLSDPARLRTLLRPLPVAVISFWAIVGVTPLWSRGTVTVTGAIRDGVLYGLDYLLPCLVTLALICNLRRARRLVLLLAAGAVILVGFAAVEFVSRSNPFVGLGPVLPQAAHWTQLDTRAGLQRVEVTFGHPLSFGRYLALVAPLIVWASLSSPARVERWCLAATTLILAVGVFLTLSAGPTITLFLGFLLTLTALGRRSLPVVAGMLVALTIFALVLPFSPQVRETMGSWLGLETSVSAQTRRNFSYRLRVFDIARHGLETSPVFGYGNRGSVPVLSPTQDIINTYVGYLLKHGIVGLIAFLAVNLTFMYTVGRAALVNPPVRPFALVLAAAMVAQLVLLLSISPVGPGERMFWVFVGLAGAVLGPGRQLTA